MTCRVFVNNSLLVLEAFFSKDFVVVSWFCSFEKSFNADACGSQLFCPRQPQWQWPRCRQGGKALT